MKKKGYASGGMMKKKGYSKGGSVRRGKPRGVGAATRGYGKAMKGRQTFDPFEGRNWVNG